MATRRANATTILGAIDLARNTRLIDQVKHGLISFADGSHGMTLSPGDAYRPHAGLATASGFVHIRRRLTRTTPAPRRSPGNVVPLLPKTPAAYKHAFMNFGMKFHFIGDAAACG